MERRSSSSPRLRDGGGSQAATPCWTRAPEQEPRSDIEERRSDLTGDLNLGRLLHALLVSEQ